MKTPPAIHIRNGARRRRNGHGVAIWKVFKPRQATCSYCRAEAFKTPLFIAYSTSARMHGCGVRVVIDARLITNCLPLAVSFSLCPDQHWDRRMGATNGDNHCSFQRVSLDYLGDQQTGAGAAIFQSGDGQYLPQAHVCLAHHQRECRLILTPEYHCNVSLPRHFEVYSSAIVEVTIGK